MKECDKLQDGLAHEDQLVGLGDHLQPLHEKQKYSSSNCLL